MEGYKRVIILKRKDGTILRVMSPVYAVEWTPDESGCYCLKSDGHGIYALANPDDPQLDNFAGTAVRVWLSGKVEHGERGYRAEAARIMDDLSTLSSANLGGADLGGANLGGANLGGANLSSANLSSANLSGAYLSSANLSWANLSRANLSGAYLGGANLSSAYLSWANLSRARYCKHTTWPDGYDPNEPVLVDC